MEVNGQRMNTESKSDKINDVKEKFFQVIKRKIGNLLVEEISKIIENEGFSSNRKIILKIPHFLKSLFSFYNDEGLLIETSLLYICYCLNLMTDEMQVIYEQNLAEIEKNRVILLKMKELLQLNKSETPVFICKFELPTYILSKYSLIEDDFENLIIFGLIKIFEWLGVFDSEFIEKYSKYEICFSSVVQRLNLSV